MHKVFILFHMFWIGFNYLIYYISHKLKNNVSFMIQAKSFNIERK